MKKIFLKPDAPLPYTKTQIPFERSILDMIEAQQDKIIKGQVEFDPSKIKLLEGGKDAKH